MTGGFPIRRHTPTRVTNYKHRARVNNLRATLHCHLSFPRWRILYYNIINPTYANTHILQSASFTSVLRSSSGSRNRINRRGRKLSRRLRCRLLRGHSLIITYLRWSGGGFKGENVVWTFPSRGVFHAAKL